VFPQAREIVAALPLSQGESPDELGEGDEGWLPA